MAEQKKQGPLAGVRIVEFAGIGPGPFASMILADLGADVVRINRPQDEPPGPKDVLGRSRTWTTADLKKPEDRDAVLALLDKADGLIDVYRPGVLERLGLGPEVVLARNPRLVYGRMTGWGQTGPLASAAGHDINYIAITGALYAIGPAEKPYPPLNLIGDYGGALYLVIGMLSAIIAARAGAPGQVIDAAMCDSAASMMSIFAELAAKGIWKHERTSNFIDGAAPHYRVYECADGEHFSIGSMEPQFYKLLCEKTGFDATEAERTNPANWAALSAKMDAIFKTKTRAEWTEILEGTDVCAAPILSLGEAPDHPHLAARQSFVTRNGVAQPAPAPRFSATPSATPVDSVQRPIAEQIEAWS
jgi:alpha-methylacyl-CoA racemase